MRQKDINISNSLVYAGKKQERDFNLFWFGFIIYTLSETLAEADSFFSFTAAQVVQTLGLVLMISVAISLIKFRIKNEYLKNVYYLYLFWLITVALRGFKFDFNFIKSMLFSIDFGIFTYLVPFILLFPVNFAFYKKTFTAVFILGAAYLVYVALFFQQMRTYDRTDIASLELIESFAGYLSLSVAFLLVTYIYHPLKKNVIAFVAMLVTLYFAIFRARRSLMFMSLSSLSFFLMSYLIISKRTGYIIFLSAFIAIVGASYMQSLSNVGLFSYVMERGEDDTRSGVEVALYADMSTQDWIIGKGISGEYYCPGVEDVNDIGATGYRGVIETGYLQIILKGGLISLVLLLLILIPAIYKGFFKSNNLLSKGAAMWILLWVLYLYPTVYNTFTMHFLLVWVSVGICYSDEIRNMPESTLLEYFKSKITKPAKTIPLSRFLNKKQS